MRLRSCATSARGRWEGGDDEGEIVEDGSDKAPPLVRDVEGLSALAWALAAMGRGDAELLSALAKAFVDAAPPVPNGANGGGGEDGEIDATNVDLDEDLPPVPAGKGGGGKGGKGGKGYGGRGGGKGGGAGQTDPTMRAPMVISTTMNPERRLLAAAHRAPGFAYPGSALDVCPAGAQAAHGVGAAAADVRGDLALLRSVHEIVSRVFSVPRPDQLSPSRAADRRMNLARLHQFETWAKEELGETQLQLDATLAGCAACPPIPPPAPPPGV